MKFAALFFGLSLAAGCAQNIKVQVDGKPVGSGTETTVNFQSGNGIIQKCSSDGSRITCVPDLDTNIIRQRDDTRSLHYCYSPAQSTGKEQDGSPDYVCSVSNGMLAGYTAGLALILVVDTPCNNKCTLSLNGIGPVSIKRADGVTDPLGTLVPGQPQLVFYDGVRDRQPPASPAFRMLGGGGASRAAGDDRERDSMARRFIAAMENIPYARAMSLETTAGDVHKTTTSNAVGNATLNAATAGLAGQHMWVIIVNDQISGKTVSFGNNFKSAGPLVGSPGKSTTLQFISDGTAWYEVARTGNL
jgi:hypothetical protein